jgi:hypothetical protein
MLMHLFICPRNNPVKGAAHVAENTTCLLIVTHSMYDVPGSDLYLQTGHPNLQFYVVLLSLRANTLKQDHNYTHSLLFVGTYFMVF